MKTFLLFAIVPAGLLAGVGLFARAEDEAKERAAGTVLLLKTGHAMEGEIARLGAQYRVRRGQGEVLIAADLAARLCADWDDAYVYAQSLIKLDDAAARLKLARWCHLNRMTDKALAQARVALQLQPENSEAKQLVLVLERATNDPPAPASTRPTETPAPLEPPPTVDVSFESLIAFTRNVQPILMNTCVKCHGSGEGGSFRLERAAGGGKKDATLRNLAAVLAQVDVERPAISPLLVKAITPHGGAATPAIRDRGAKPLQAMQQWIELTLKKNPQLKDYAAAKKAPATEVRTAAKSAPPAAPFAAKGVVVSELAVTPAQAKVPAAHAPPMPEPLDEFSPVFFNRRYHPKR